MKRLPESMRRAELTYHVLSTAATRTPPKVAMRAVAEPATPDAAPRFWGMEVTTPQMRMAAIVVFQPRWGGRPGPGVGAASGD